MRMRNKKEEDVQRKSFAFGTNETFIGERESLNLGYIEKGLKRGCGASTG